MFSINKSMICSIQQGHRLKLPVCINILQEVLVNSFRRVKTNNCLETEDKMVQYGVREEKSSKAMRAYLERSQAYNKFMAEEEKEFKSGKRHLANMMGKDFETFTQDEVNEAIKYLFPSALFVKRTRPFMKPPVEVHPPKKEAEFDETGRPYHSLFYTGKPNYYQFLQKLVETMRELNVFEDTMIRKQLKPDPALALSLEGYQWLPQEDFEKKFIEKLTESEYNQLIATLERLVAHPYSYRVMDLVTEARAVFKAQTTASLFCKPELQADGREFVTVKDSRRKTARADVTVRSPGTGLLTINGFDLSYFEDMHHREQLLFPLQVSGKVNTVDVESTVRGGGPTVQAGAIRFGIAKGLCSFLPPEVIEKMRLVGLLTADRRRKERKKPGQAGARRKFTWKKR